MRKTKTLLAIGVLDSGVYESEYALVIGLFEPKVDALFEVVFDLFGRDGHDQVCANFHDVAGVPQPREWWVQRDEVYVAVPP